MSDDGGYSTSTPRREPLTVPFLEGIHAAAEGARKWSKHKGICDGCSFCEAAAEAKAEDQ